MDNIILYAPYALFIIISLVNLKIFARSDEISVLKAYLITYMSEHYVSDKTYRENHKSLQEQLAQIHTDINDVKNILISKGT
nr:MAG TPA: hypothetical protein [Caudoviricetes sp.]